MLDETSFHTIAGATLTTCYEQLEPAFDRGEIEELDFAEGILSIALPGGKTFIVSKHAPTRQLWLASPLSGGLHFSYSGQDWLLGDGRTLSDVLRTDLERAGMKVAS